MNILITGTSSGLGNGLSGFYLQKGFTVTGISRRTPSEYNNNPQYTHYECDLSDFTSTMQLKGNLQDSYFDLVILNAGILPKLGDLQETSIEEIKKVMDINVWSNKILIDLLLQSPKPPKQIVAISSGASVSGSRGWNAYSLSKASLNMLVNLYAKESGETHISALAPGLIDSAMQDIICAEEESDSYPVFSRLKSARGTEIMPSPTEAAEPIAQAFEKLLEYENGVFADIRKM